MARDPQKLRKAYEYKLGKDLADKLSDAHITSLSNYYNRASNEEQSKIDSELIKGMGDFLNSARDLAKEGFVRDPKLPIQKYQPEDKAKDDFVEGVDKKLDEKLSETSDSIMSEIDKLITEYQKKVDDYKKPKKEEEEKIPEGLDSLLKDIRSEVGSDTPKKGGALAVAPKPDSAKEKKLLGDEDINPEILKILGIDDVIDLDYGEYHTLLRESMVKNKDKFSAEQQALFAEERSRVRGKTGSFKVKSKKINAQSFVAKTKPTSSVKKVTPLLPSVTPQETEQPIQPERQGMDKTLALIASKLNSVDKNVQQTTRNLQDKDAAENKQKNQDRLTAENTAAQRKEERIERADVLGGVVAGVKKTVKPLTDMMGGLFDFFQRLGFATLIMELLKFLQDPDEYIKGLKIWANNLIQTIENSIKKAIKNYIIIPLNKEIKKFNSGIQKLVDFINPVLAGLSFIPGIRKIEEYQTPQVPMAPENAVDGISLPKFDVESSPTETMMGRPTTDQETSSGSSSSNVIVSDDEEEYLMRLMVAEAGGEGELGMAAVARSVMNRAGLIQSGQVGSGTFMAKSGSITDVIEGTNQYQPFREGKLEKELTEEERKKAEKALKMAKNQESLRRNLKTSGMGNTDIDNISASTGFRTHSADYDASQDVNPTKLGGHQFNTAGNANMLTPGANIETTPAPQQQQQQQYTVPLSEMPDENSPPEEWTAHFERLKRMGNQSSTTPKVDLNLSSEQSSQPVNISKNISSTNIGKPVNGRNRVTTLTTDGNQNIGVSNSAVDGNQTGIIPFSAVNHINFQVAAAAATYRVAVG